MANNDINYENINQQLRKLPLTSELLCDFKEITLKIPNDILIAVDKICDFLERTRENFLTELLIREFRSIYDIPSELLLYHCNVEEVSTFKKLSNGLENWCEYLEQTDLKIKIPTKNKGD